MKGLKASITFEVWQLDKLTIEITIGYIINDTIYLLKNNPSRSIIEIVLSNTTSLKIPCKLSSTLCVWMCTKKAHNLSELSKKEIGILLYLHHATFLFSLYFWVLKLENDYFSFSFFLNCVMEQEWWSSIRWFSQNLAIEKDMKLKSFLLYY